MIYGVVAIFDEDRGHGVVVSDDGEQLYFHCVGISDGSRRIDVGARVKGRRAVGQRGRDEISDLSPANE